MTERSGKKGAILLCIKDTLNQIRHDLDILELHIGGLESMVEEPPEQKEDGE